MGDRFKYALYDKGLHREQLYDLDAEPGEMRNYAEEYPDVLANMRSRLLHASAIDP